MIEIRVVGLSHSLLCACGVCVVPKCVHASESVRPKLLGCLTHCCCGTDCAEVRTGLRLCRLDRECVLTIEVLMISLSFSCLSSEEHHITT